MPRVFEPIPAEVEALAKQAVDACLKVHRALGPGLLESVYVMCLAHELRKRGLNVETEVPVDVYYDNVKMDAGFRMDLLLEGKLVIEVKAVEVMNPVFKAQLLTYLKLSKLRLGLLVNFNSELIKDGIERIAC